jgi:hypothetical protein
MRMLFRWPLSSRTGIQEVKQMSNSKRATLHVVLRDDCIQEMIKIRRKLLARIVAREERE